MPGHDAPICDIKFNGDRGIVASCGEDGKVVLRDGKTWKIDRILNHEKAVFTICFSNDGRLLATAGDGDNIRIWDLSAGTFVFLKGHQDRVQMLILLRMIVS